MNAYGWIFLILSTIFVWGLVITCYWKLLTAPKPPPHEFEEFHSA
jgi:hypothetical protein